MGYPFSRPRRLRKTEILRNLIRETHLSLNYLVYPLFVKEMTQMKTEIPSMPGIYQFSPDGLLREIEELLNLSIRSVLLFGIPGRKDEVGSEAYREDGIIQKTVKKIKKAFGDDLVVITDVCLCEYTSHGHCGVLKGDTVDNDETIKILAKVALSHAESGADIVAPSDMMDGRVQAIRRELDSNGYSHIPIMSYSAKYASSLYGPFRVAAESKPQFGDRRSYQMDYPNKKEALKEIELDIAEGADIVMVKPAIFYLDIIGLARSTFNVPIAAYSVSGEYLMVKEAAKTGFIDYKSLVVELTTSIRRAGADIIITYFAKDIAKWMREGSL
ncbi:MAG: porphobilinogen synthase [Desulfobacterota bacterium]|nr:porphobilinogen synthase [Thermodesulfobacteriota bacterium]MDW8001049.1 porphobilinogen synthase [Deltaproteobacteria bacterium]